MTPLWVDPDALEHALKTLEGPGDPGAVLDRVSAWPPGEPRGERVAWGNRDLTVVGVRSRFYRLVLEDPAPTLTRGPLGALGIARRLGNPPPEHAPHLETLRAALEAREGRALPENTVAVGEYAGEFQGEVFPARLAFTAGVTRAYLLVPEGWLPLNPAHTALLRHLVQEPREVSLGFPPPVTPGLLRDVLEGKAHPAVLGLLLA